MKHIKLTNEIRLHFEALSSGNGGSLLSKEIMYRLENTLKALSDLYKIPERPEGVRDMPYIDPNLLGEMVRQYRKAGFEIPEGQPRTSQDGEYIARIYNHFMGQ